MNWYEAKIENCISKYDDILIQQSKYLVEESKIFEKDGLSVSQAHRLLQRSQTAGSIANLRHFVHKESKRSYPKEPEKLISGEGKNWKKGWSKDKNGEIGEFFCLKLQKSFNRLEDIADYIANDVGYEHKREIGIMVARRFLTYFNWHIKILDKESSHV